MKRYKVIYFTWALLIFTFLVLAILVFTPVPVPTESNTYDRYDAISNVYEGPSNDIVFCLENDSVKPYINRGLELGLTIDSLNSKVKGKNVHLKFVNHWTPLDYSRSGPTLAFLALADSGEIIFNNIKTN